MSYVTIIIGCKKSKTTLGLYKKIYEKLLSLIKYFPILNKKNQIFIRDKANSVNGFSVGSGFT